MIKICASWKDANGHLVHREPKVLVPEDGKDAQVSHGICPECKDAFLERAALVHAAKEAARCSPVTGVS